MNALFSAKQARIYIQSNVDFEVSYRRENIFEIYLDAMRWSEK